MNYKRGDIVICIDNYGAKLTIGKRYEIINVVRVYSDGDCYLKTTRDGGDGIYDSARFISISEIRDNIIDEILE